MKLSIHRPAILAWGSRCCSPPARCSCRHRAPRQPRTAGPCWSRTSIRVAPPASPPSTAASATPPITEASSPTSTGPSTSAPRTASTASSSGEATAQGKGTRMVKDINPGKGWSNLSGITAVNRIIYFTADDGVHGAELWRSDGTARGTRMVKDINPGPGSGGPGQLTDVNGTLYFTAVRGQPRQRAVAKRRHPGGDDHGQERERLWPDRFPRRPLLLRSRRTVAERRDRGWERPSSRTSSARPLLP